MLRSNLGSHIAGHGMAYPSDYNDDEKIEVLIPKSKVGCKLSTDNLDKDKLNQYCKEQSGEVKSYNLYDTK